MKSPDEYPNTTVSDENDENPRYVRYEEIIPKGLIRRVTEIFVVDVNKKLVLLQRRSNNVAVSPNTLTSSIGEGIDEGEEYEDAAKRGLSEELGLPDTPLTELGKYYSETAKSSNEKTKLIKTWSKVFAVKYDGSPIIFEEEEIAGVEWYTLDEVDQQLESQPEHFSMRFPVTWKNMRPALEDFITNHSKVS